jgi:hypothetical protein
MRLIKWVAIPLLVVFAVASLWTWASLSWSYSEGQRAGVLQKFSRKGWFCKTYEGELALYVVSGVAPQIWYFTVRDETVAKQLMGMTGQKVQVSYAEHKGIPSSCFGDTQYFAQGATVVAER